MLLCWRCVSSKQVAAAQPSLFFLGRPEKWQEKIMAVYVFGTAKSRETATMSSTEGKMVDVSCYDFLYMEMVDYIVRNSQSNDQVFQTLEQLGFRVGQRLAERFCPPPT
jgi:hypothetical protein